MFRLPNHTSTEGRTVLHYCIRSNVYLNNKNFLVLIRIRTLSRKAYKSKENLFCFSPNDIMKIIAQIKNLHVLLEIGSLYDGAFGGEWSGVIHRKMFLLVNIFPLYIYSKLFWKVIKYYLIDITWRMAKQFCRFYDFLHNVFNVWQT